MLSKRILNSLFVLFYSGVEHADEIYSLCQLVSPAAAIVTTAEPATAVVPEKPSSQPRQQQQRPAAAAVVKRSSTEKVFAPKCLVDSSTFLLPAGDGPVRLDVKNVVQTPKTATVTATTIATANVFKKKPPIVCSESPKAATAKIFAPRTEDMNKGFLTFSDDDTGLTS